MSSRTLGDRSMLRSMLIAAIAGALACVVATIAAAFLYLVVVLREPFTIPAATAVVFFGFGVSMRGLLLAVPACVLLNIISKRIPRVIFVAAAMLAGAMLAVGLSYWLFNPMFHVWREGAAVLLALTWASAAVILATAGSRPPA